MTTQSIFSETIDLAIGNMNGRTPRVVLDLSGFSIPENITKFRARLQGHADEPFTVASMYAGVDNPDVAVTVSGQSAFTVPQGADVWTDWIDYTSCPNTFSMYCNGGTGADRLSGVFNTPHTFWLKSQGDFANQQGLSGFVEYSGYHGLVAEIEVEYTPQDTQPDMSYRRYLMGCEPEIVNDNTLRIFQGSWVTSTASPQEIYSNGYIDIDLTKTGLNCLDTGAMTIGQDYFVYLLRNPTSGNIGAVVSKEISITGVTKPAGYTQIRKLPWGFVWRGALEPMHIDGWPTPFTRWHFAQQTNDYAAITDGEALTGGSFNLSGFLPDSSRLAYLNIKVTGSGTVEIGASAQKLFEVKDGAFVHARCTSGHDMFYKTTGSAKLSAYVFGYTQTERS